MATTPDEVLKTHGLRSTRNRHVVLEEFSHADFALSQPELEKRLKGEMDRVTLYRILSSFEEKGILHSIVDQFGTTNYASCSSSCRAGHHKDQHIHFNCLNCRKIYCLPSNNPPVDIPAGFNAENISIIAIGLCKACNSN